MLYNTSQNGVMKQILFRPEKLRHGVELLLVRESFHRRPMHCLSWLVDQLPFITPAFLFGKWTSHRNVTHTPHTANAHLKRHTAMHHLVRSWGLLENGEHWEQRLGIEARRCVPRKVHLNSQEWSSVNGRNLDHSSWFLWTLSLESYSPYAEYSHPAEKWHLAAWQS